MSQGLLILYTGHGKGKTTAAFGMAYRAMGRGWPVAVVQFIKGKWMTGERMFSEHLPLLELHVMGEGFTWESEDISRDQRAAERAWETCERLMQEGKHKLLIFDEMTYAMNYGWLDIERVRQSLRQRHPEQTVVITGRNAPEALLADADLVTEMKALKHPFEQGYRAQPGVDF